MNPKIVIADSGSTKTDWSLLFADGTRCEVATQGMNPFHLTDDALRGVLQNELRPHVSGTPSSIAFYGSGCTPEQAGRMAALIGDVFPDTEVEVPTDLLGAARALCGRQPGVACILGTGSNSCLYDGHDIVKNTPALGYILDDEGGGAALGRDFVADLFKGLLPSSLAEAFVKETGQDQAQIIERVYRQPLANRYLASFTRFIGGHCDEPEVHEFLVTRFRRFFVRNVRAYGRPDLPVHFVGSIAAVFCSELSEAAALEGFTVGTVSRSPMEGLIKYHAV